MPTAVAGVREESEEQISVQLYSDLRKLYSHPSCKTIVKTRYKFEYKGRIFELDVYGAELSELVILEVEVPSVEEMERLQLPPQFQLLDVTNDKRFSNRSLAEYGMP